MPTSGSTGCPRIVIIGAGAAGVFTAYRVREMYGDAYELVLVESNGRVGGNTSTTKLKYGGHEYSIDCGAQFFYKNPQASYVGLIEDLGLFDDPPQIQTKPTGITIWDRKANDHLLWIPSRARGFLRYRPEDWDRMIGFGTFLAYSFLLDRADDPDWTVSVDDWIAKLKLLDQKFKDQVVRNFLYQFITLPPDRIGEGSALYAITYFVRNVFGEAHVVEPDPDIDDPPGAETFEVYQSLIGLDGILLRALETAGVKPRLREPVTAIRKNAAGKLEVKTLKDTIVADHVVLATDPQVAAAILTAGGWSAPDLIASLRKLEYAELPISMQKGGSCWMPGDSRYWEAVNTIVEPKRINFTAWFGPLRNSFSGGKKIPVFKSWSSPGLDPEECEHNFLGHDHKILMPTTTFMVERAKVQACQGKDNLWFAGGWTNWFDSQEAALDSATEIAERLPGTARVGTGRAAMVPYDRDAQRRRVDRWLKRIARRAPLAKRKQLIDLVKKVEAMG